MESAKRITFRRDVNYADCVAASTYRALLEKCAERKPTGVTLSTYVRRLRRDRLLSGSFVLTCLLFKAQHCQLTGLKFAIAVTGRVF
ncbi:hypothetical protein EVAR_17688_1 [Eumeta japonica]|uniref:Uncharacterized protein n=1 Tax=Eumeta variegata TaxID=151549 RepID=A0A4C1USF1_EUMVA|nr:hypothetical protein EVAR_17688_1 [Eumeta japonica]